ncbi:hypothetical protein NONI108955_36770 [Nocardia ninae]|uniref:Uncharacterized protein n=1 Tax=Nocardia ninae NBRC 108245 TaxID=1210091 RepID=A0A511MDC8_9NOCA|nr:hypothetical protein [Nocardia ninae]GEM38654.1 hypothetical protein NN4_31730 [Nocardia ninae NBRC 108245]
MADTPHSHSGDTCVCSQPAERRPTRQEVLALLHKALESPIDDLHANQLRVAIGRLMLDSYRLLHTCELSVEPAQAGETEVDDRKSKILFGSDHESVREFYLRLRSLFRCVGGLASPQWADLYLTSMIVRFDVSSSAAEADTSMALHRAEVLHSMGTTEFRYVRQALVNMFEALVSAEQSDDD